MNEQETEKDKKDETTQNTTNTQTDTPITNTQADTTTTTTTTDTTTAQDKAALSSLSDKELYLDSSSVKNLCSSWQSKVASLNLTGERITSELKPLTTLGILKNYATCLATAINAITSSVSQITSSLSTVTDDQVQIDDDGYNRTQTPGGGTYYTDYTPGGGSTTSSTSQEEETSVDNTKPKQSVLDMFASIVTTPVELSKDEYIKVQEALANILKENGVTVDQVVGDDIKIAALKALLLKNINISEELKKKILNLDSSIIVEMLNKLNLSDVVDIDAESKNFLYDYLETVSTLNNISVNDLINKEEYADLLRDSINYYKKGVTYMSDSSKNGTLQASEDILKIYDGDITGSIDTELVESVRNIVDTKALTTNTQAESLITGDIKKIFQDAISSKDYVDKILGQGTTSTSVQSAIKSLYQTA